ncbi:MAG: hypothetical protein ACI97A_003166 [Planctomycetota bacterium]|jgi:hypothetical protein
MKAMTLDKIASVTMNCDLSRRVKVGDKFPCKEGDVVAVRVLTQKSAYNSLELTTGRFSQLKPGDIIAGALGHRNALRGYAGHMPEALAVGDHLQILNLGGVLGICDSVNPDVGQPFDCEVLGQVLDFPVVGERLGQPANISQGLPKLLNHLECSVPVIAVVGTSMSAGKTFACTSIIQELTHAGLQVAAAKATGVSLRRDTLAMEDAGASHTMSFNELGVVTTTAENAPDLTRTMLHHLAMTEPHVIILELGDGLMGTYGVAATLACEDIKKSFAGVVLAAHDPVGAWGGWEQLRREYDIETTVLTGPATDNLVGTELARKRLGIDAHNARTDAVGLSNVIKRLLL